MIGRRTWVIVDGWIPPGSTGPAPEMTSHDTICILNAGHTNAEVAIILYYTDRPPVGPYVLHVAAQRILHQRTNDLTDPEPVPTATDYAAVIASNAPIVVQHTRLDSRQGENTIMTTIAHGA